MIGEMPPPSSRGSLISWLLVILCLLAWTLVRTQPESSKFKSNTSKRELYTDGEAVTPITVCVEALGGITLLTLGVNNDRQGGHYPQVCYLLETQMTREPRLTNSGSSSTASETPTRSSEKLLSLRSSGGSLASMSTTLKADATKLFMRPCMKPPSWAK